MSLVKESTHESEVWGVDICSDQFEVQKIPMTAERNLIRI